MSPTATATVTYTTDHDALGRPSDLYMRPPQQPITLVNSATYNAAGQLTAMVTPTYTETRQYNANLQLTQLAAGGGQGINFTYTYPTSGNIGRISQMTDNITPEQVNYTYDVLNRLVQAGTMPFAYDGFGNLTQQGQTYLSIDQTTNCINSAGYQYNANGNVTQTPGSPPPTYSYDVANRLVSNNAIPTDSRVGRLLPRTSAMLSRITAGAHVPRIRIRPTQIGLRIVLKTLGPVTGTPPCPTWGNKMGRLVWLIMLCLALACAANAQEKSTQSKPCSELVTDFVPGLHAQVEKAALAHVEIRRCDATGGSMQVVAWKARSRAPSLILDSGASKRLKWTRTRWLRLSNWGGFRDSPLNHRTRQTLPPPRRESGTGYSTPPRA
jgi:hypothetical protein